MCSSSGGSAYVAVGDQSLEIGNGGRSGCG